MTILRFRTGTKRDIDIGGGSCAYDCLIQNNKIPQNVKAKSDVDFLVIFKLTFLVVPLNKYFYCPWDFEHVHMLFLSFDILFPLWTCQSLSQ